MRQTLTDSVTSYWDEHLHDLAVARHPIGTKQFFEDLTEYHFDKQRHLSRIIDYASYDGKELLDVGCGVGVDGVRFAEHGAHVTGVDISTRAIELARNNFDYAGLDADLRVMEGENLEFADHTFDAVYAHGILPYAKDFHRVAMEVHRVLKPGGEAIFQTYNRRSWLYLLWKSMKVSLEHEQAPCFHIHSREEVDELVRQFKEAHVITERFPVRTRLQTGTKGALYNLLFVGAFNAIPRPFTLRFALDL